MRTNDHNMKTSFMCINQLSSTEMSEKCFQLIRLAASVAAAAAVIVGFFSVDFYLSVG